ncbi:hypothetical protein EPNKCIFM_00213 [Klebsiella phage KP13-16]|nr:hypothetical protein EPNKCIFM_00213 [Klebsiella phage KP13-16]
MEIINQREVVGKIFNTRSKAVSTMSALLEDKFQINKMQDKWLVSYEKETSIIMDGEFTRAEADDAEKLTDNSQ